MCCNVLQCHNYCAWYISSHIVRWLVIDKFRSVHEYVFRSVHVYIFRSVHEYIFCSVHEYIFHTSTSNLKSCWQRRSDSFQFCWYSRIDACVVQKSCFLTRPAVCCSVCHLIFLTETTVNDSQIQKSEHVYSFRQWICVICSQKWDDTHCSTLQVVTFLTKIYTWIWVTRENYSVWFTNEYDSHMNMCDIFLFTSSYQKHFIMNIHINDEIKYTYHINNEISSY